MFGLTSQKELGLRVTPQWKAADNFYLLGFFADIAQHAAMVRSRDHPEAAAGAE